MGKPLPPDESPATVGRMLRRVVPGLLSGLVFILVGALAPVAPATALPAAPAHLAQTTSPPLAPTVASRTAVRISAAQFVRRVVQRTNLKRARHGCRALRVSPRLVLAAQRHSNLMARRGQVSHRLAGEGTLVQRIAQVRYTGWRMLAENLAWGQRSPYRVVRAWMHSPGHRRNNLNCRLRDVGVGVAMRNGRPFVTEDFGRR